ncbi:IS701 family transposase [Trichormus variabilis]|uniref:DDE transposase n=1 Tax=Trichormus variabilis SAG 1403-4b TaxID=447716 RepID=A0A3S1A5N0_ANAVA|nr:IS701 family transposase [Trichormus variabilis]MBD2629255.1 IS701 family transposase [Trichormus variabilis FACHB-164]RUS93822.1 DDE transposase [Trichormus variabilis SAG 1403-4b]
MTQPRIPNTTVSFIDNYCTVYQKFFPEVKSYDAFKQLHLGITAEIKRKTLPAIAKAVGLINEESLLYFLTESPWSIEEIRKQRLEIILQKLGGKEIVLIIDETGDKKKGKTTDYVDRQYIGNLGKIEQGIVSVNAYGVWQGITFPLLFKVYKPKKRLKENDIYKTKTQLVAEIITELQEMGFKLELVLTDSLYEESETFLSILNQYKLPFIMAIRSNHAVLMPNEQRVRVNKWKEFERIFTNSKSKNCYMREIIFGKRRNWRYWQITTDKNNLPDNSTWYVMTNLSDAPPSVIGNNYGLMTWIEYGFKQYKNQLGWADFRCTDYHQIERWWEIVSSAFLMISLQFSGINQPENTSNDYSDKDLLLKLRQHPW